MARRVTLATIGAKPLLGGNGLAPDRALELMTEHWTRELDQVLPDRPDLIVLPEACDRFGDQALPERLDYYAHRSDRLREFFAAKAARHRCYIAYSAARQLDDGTWRNSTQILDRQGQVCGVYNKNHVVIEETTLAGILPGKEAPIIETDFGRLACAICFDLNFDELRLKVKALHPDLIVFSSAYHGGLMQPYWAYSCRAHFIGAIFGTHPSSIISPIGETIAHSTNYFDYAVATVNLDCAVAHLDYNWDKFRAAKQKYGPGITITDPGCLGSVLIACHLEDRTIRDIVSEFGIELLDDYWERALAHSHTHCEP